MTSGLFILVGLYGLAVAAVLALFAAPYAFFIYNRFVRLQTSAKAALGDIDVLLKKRHDLVPGLVDAVRDYAGHENGIFTEVSGLRSGATPAATVAERAEADGALRGLLKNFSAVAENYPALKADRNFRQLMEALQQVEDAIESARRHYNAVVREYNILLSAIPSRIVGRIGGFAPEEFFELADEEQRQPQRIVGR